MFRLDEQMSSVLGMRSADVATVAATRGACATVAACRAVWRQAQSAGDRNSAPHLRVRVVRDVRWFVSEFAHERVTPRERQRGSK